MRKANDLWILEAIFWTIISGAYLAYLSYTWPIYGQAPMTDPVAYPELARAMRYFYDSGGREPLYIFFIKLLTRTVKPNDFALRLGSVLSTAAAAALLTAWARWQHGFLVAALAALALALNGTLAYYAPQGYNMPAYGAMLTLFAALWLGCRDSRYDAIAWGISGAACALTRLEGALVVAVILTYTAINAKLRKKALTALAVVATLTLPYLIAQKATSGEFFASHRGHANFWATRADEAASGSGPTAQSDKSWSDAFFGHNPIAFAGRWLKGYALAILWYAPRLWQACSPLLIFALIALQASWRKHDYDLTVFLAAITLPVAFILPQDQVGPGSGVELRFVLPLSYPLALLCGLGLSQTLRSLRTQSTRLIVK